MNTRVILISLIGFLAMGGCSVKEDRTACPLWLSNDMTALLAHSTSAWSIIRHEEGLVREEVFFKDSMALFERTVPKGEIIAAAYCGLDERHLQEHRMVVPTGEHAPLFHGSFHTETCHDEMMHVVTKGNRQSAKLNLRAVVPDGEPYPYDLLLEGDICGMDLLSLTPIEGRFEHPIKLDSDNCATVQILRQTDSSSLTVHIIDEAKVIESIPLGQWIRKTGYNWDDDDLEDISMSIEQGRLELTVIISDWEHGNGEESKYEFIF